MNIPEGAEVHVQHFRPAENSLGTLVWQRHDFKRRGTKPAAKGGFTLVKVTLPDGTWAEGIARCSKLDNFNRSKGRLIATGRALKNLEAL